MSIKSIWKYNLTRFLMGGEVSKGQDIEVKSYSRAGEIFWDHLSVSDWEPLSVNGVKGT